MKKKIVSKRNTERFDVVRVNDMDDILNNEDPGPIARQVVKANKLCEIQLKGDGVHVSMLVRKDVFDRIRHYDHFNVESEGWWNTLADDCVVVTTPDGQMVRAENLF